MISIVNGLVCFNFYQGPNRGSNLVYTINFTTRSTSLWVGPGYTVYEERWGYDYSTPNHNYYFYNNYWLDNNTGIAYPTSWVPGGTPSNVTVTVFGNAVLINNLGARALTSLFLILSLEIQEMPIHYYGPPIG